MHFSQLAFGRSISRLGIELDKSFYEEFRNDGEATSIFKNDGLSIFKNDGLSIFKNDG